MVECKTFILFFKYNVSAIKTYYSNFWYCYLSILYTVCSYINSKSFFDHHFTLCNVPKFVASYQSNAG